jgi:hypothetical protein
MNQRKRTEIVARVTYGRVMDDLLPVITGSCIARTLRSVPH